MYLSCVRSCSSLNKFLLYCSIFLRCPSLWQFMQRNGLGIYKSIISWCQSVILIIGGSSVHWNVIMYLFVVISWPLNIRFILSTLTAPWSFNASLLLVNVSLTRVPLVYLRVFCFSTVTFSSANLLIFMILSPCSLEWLSIRRESYESFLILFGFPIFFLMSLSIAITFRLFSMVILGNFMMKNLSK